MKTFVHTTNKSYFQISFCRSTWGCRTTTLIDQLGTHRKSWTSLEVKRIHCHLNPLWHLLLVARLLPISHPFLTSWKWRINGTFLRVALLPTLNYGFSFAAVWNQCFQLCFLFDNHAKLQFSFYQSLTILIIFNTFKCGVFSKIKIQGLQNDQTCRFWPP